MPNFIITTKDTTVGSINCALTKNDNAKIIAPIDSIINVNDIRKRPYENESEEGNIWCDGWNACLDYLLNHTKSLEELDFCSEIKTPSKRVVVDKELNEFANGFDIGWNSCIEHTIKLNRARACQNNGNKR